MTNNANKKHRANNLENKKNNINDINVPHQRKGNSENPPAFENHDGKPIK